MTDDLYNEDSNDNIESESFKKLKEDFLLKHSIYEDFSRDFDIEDGIIYLADEIYGEGDCVDFIKMVRSIRKYNPNIKAITLVIDSPGGAVHEMLGIVDYINHLDKNLGIKVNTICRGKAMSAGAMILACGTGTRSVSENSSIMLHDLSGMNYGKVKDMEAHTDHSKDLKRRMYKLLADKTNKDVEYWNQKMSTDYFISPEEAINLGIVDKII